MGKGRGGEEKLSVVLSWQDPVVQVTLVNLRSCSHVVHITGLPHTS